MNVHEALALLTEELDSETVGDLIGQFCTDTPKQIAALRSALTQNDLQTLARTAHSVAGSSSTFGLQELRGAALLVEESAQAGQTAQLAEQIEAVAAAYERAVPPLQKIIQR